MSSEKKRPLETWAVTRKKGVVNFVLIYGVLGWGVSTALLWSGVMSLVSSVDMAAALPTSLALFSSFGALFGLLCWFILEWRFNTTR